MRCCAASLMSRALDASLALDQPGQHQHRPAEGRGRRGLERRHHGALLLLLLRLAVHAAPALEVAVAPATSRRTPVVISHGRLAERARYPTCARCPELLPLMLELRLRVR
uniref:Uncharacterized protein n=1 Tax=Zea mays TaxID=4577 RepID=A0A804MCD4_MAIZE